jgi:hypothetical protein
VCFVEKNNSMIEKEMVRREEWQEGRRLTIWSSLMSVPTRSPRKPNRLELTICLCLDRYRPLM